MNTNETSKSVSWQALEYPEYRKHPLWFVGFSIIIALLVLFGIFSKSWTTVTVFILFGILGIVYAAKKPEEVTIKLSGQGISVNKLFYNFKVIKKFWIVYNPPEVKSLYIETTAYFNHIVKLELGNQDPREVREFLKRYLEEDVDEVESFADAVARKIRF